MSRIWPLKSQLQLVPSSGHQVNRGKGWRVLLIAPASQLLLQPSDLLAPAFPSPLNSGVLKPHPIWSTLPFPLPALIPHPFFPLLASPGSRTSSALIAPSTALCKACSLHHAAPYTVKGAVVSREQKGSTRTPYWEPNHAPRTPIHCCLQGNQDLLCPHPLPSPIGTQLSPCSLWHCSNEILIFPQKPCTSLLQ